MFFIAGIMLPHKPKSGASFAAHDAQAVETHFSRIPRGAVRLKDGYAVVNSPEFREGIIFSNGQPITIQSGEDGSIILLDEHGEVMARYAIPWGPPPFALEFQEAAIPWWYANRAILFAGILFAAAIALFTWMIVSRRRRAEHTLGITMDYLRPLAQGNYSLRA